MPKILGYSTLGGSPYLFAGFGADAGAVAPAALSAPYDLNQPGRVREIKQALAAVGKADNGQETLWRVLSDDDSWDDAAQDEYVTFLSRWANKLPCFPAPLVFLTTAAHPTFTGLLLLDAAYRYATSNLITKGISLVQGCSTGVPSTSFMPILEQYLTGEPASASAVLLNRPDIEKIQIQTSDALTPHPIPPPDVDVALYAQWVQANDSVKQIWASLSKAVTDEARMLALAAVTAARGRRDGIAQSIIAKAPPRTGSTDVENVGRCPDGQTWDQKTNRCITPFLPASISGTTVGIALALAGAAWFAFKGNGKRRPSRRRAYG
jgi:hypothetical protein